MTTHDSSLPTRSLLRRDSAASGRRPARRCRALGRVALALAAATLLGRGALAQSPAARPTLNRAALEAQVAAERRPEVAARLRERLQDGDFNVGDRVVLEMRRDSTTTVDTLVVRAGRLVTVEGISEIPLTGVLRSELDARMTERIGRYVRSPSVRTWSLFRLAVLGEVTKPNYYYVPPDMLVSDLVVLAGGPTPNADLDRSIARRGASRILEPERFRYALRSGQTLDELSFRAGDEVVIGKKHELNWAQIATGASIGISLIVATVSLVRR